MEKYFDCLATGLAEAALLIPDFRRYLVTSWQRSIAQSLSVDNREVPDITLAFSSDESRDRDYAGSRNTIFKRSSTGDSGQLLGPNWTIRWAFYDLLLADDLDTSEHEAADQPEWYLDIQLVDNPRKFAHYWVGTVNENFKQCAMAMGWGDNTNLDGQTELVEQNFDYVVPLTLQPQSLTAN